MTTRPIAPPRLSRNSRRVTSASISTSRGQSGRRRRHRVRLQMGARSERRCHGRDGWRRPDESCRHAAPDRAHACRRMRPYQRQPAVSRATPIACRGCVFSAIRSSLCSTKIASGYWHLADSQCGYTAINRRALQQIDWDQMYKRYGQPNDLLVRLNVHNMRVRDVEVEPIYHVGGKSGSARIAWWPIGRLLLRRFI
jgi:hypothetical protein